MTQRRSVSVMVWGVLSILAGALMVEGGIMEVIVYWQQGQTSNVVVGTLGAVASAILVVSGVAFCTRLPFGRQTAIAGAIGMVPIHLVGWLLGFVGIPGVILGVAYPTLLLFVLRAKPNFGAPTDAEAGPARNGLPPPPDHTKQRTALSAA
jgi:hypothetical protein